jgi:hypothetical protein
VAAQIARVVVLAGRRLLVVGDERYVETALLGDGGEGCGFSSSVWPPVPSCDSRGNDDDD